jgi:ATP adenylyltransferase/5',5'''-P-1,P-4-tetraphosphate phosphorylase II
LQVVQVPLAEQAEQLAGQASHWFNSLKKETPVHFEQIAVLGLSSMQELIVPAGILGTVLVMSQRPFPDPESYCAVGLIA